MLIEERAVPVVRPLHGRRSGARVRRLTVGGGRWGKACAGHGAGTGRRASQEFTPRRTILAHACLLRRSDF